MGTKFHFKQTILNFGTKFTTGGQIQGTFAQGYHPPSLTFTAFSWIARYHYFFNVSSPGGLGDNYLEEITIATHLNDYFQLLWVSPIPPSS